MTFIVILHMPSDSESNLISILQNATGLTVEAAASGTTVEPNHVYVIPPGHRLTIADGVLHLESSATAHDISTVDGFFRSLARDQTDHAVGMVFSGTGTDGALGLRAINEGGGITMVQDPTEAAHDGMPESAKRASLIDCVAPVRELAEILLRYQKASGMIQLPSQSDALNDERKSVLQRIFAQLLTTTGHDFTNYKRSTVLRRLERRLRISATTSLKQYFKRLQADEEEVWDLHRDLLISVTSFFRDPEAFEALRTTIIPTLFDGKTSGDSVRVWVPGCATGEEAYSIAMLLLEHADSLEQPPHLQVFATDVDEQALQFGRNGVYPRTIETDLAAERLERFFDLEMDHYRVRPRLREIMLFARHNLLVDPPFSNLDLISCRNLLIYLNWDAQDYVFRVCHYGLRENGYLFLGRSEAGGRAAHFFTSVDKSNNIFQARLLPRKQRDRIPLVPSTRSSLSTNTLPSASVQSSSSGLSPQETRPTSKDLHKRALLQDVASVIVDEKYDIIHLSEKMSRYLTLQSGDPSLHLLDCVPKDLRSELRSALYQSVADDAPVVRRRIPVSIGDETQMLNVYVQPFNEPGDSQTVIHVRFENETSIAQADETPETIEEKSELQEELDRTHEQLRGMTEQYQAATEEMEAANEELLSMNEELQSKNEELETSQEELQSVNEELKTTNQELKQKVEEVRETNAALENLMAVTQIATLFLDADLVIRRFTPAARDLFNIRVIDVGRPLSDLTHQLAYKHLLEDVHTVVDQQKIIEREVQGHDDRWFLARLSPYTASDDAVEGVVMTFVDITGRRTLEREVVNASEEERQRIGRNLHDVVSSDLAALAMKAENLMHRLEEADGAIDTVGRLHDITAMARRAATQVRRLSHALVPVALQEEHLAAALQHLCKEQHDLLDVACVFEGNREEPLPTSKETSMHLYRIAHEAITNAVRHADANTISVVLRRNNADLVLEVRDDGKGMTATDTTRRGIGIQTMEYRAHLIGATLSIDRQTEGNGTVVRCSLPLPRAIQDQEGQR